MTFKKFFLLTKNFDWILLVAVILLMVLGLIALYSIALSQENPDFFIFKKQLLFAGVGMILFFVFSILDYRIFRNYYFWLLAFGVVLLTAVLLFGATIRGTRGWLYIGPLGMQPVEIVKIILIIFLATYFSKHIYELQKFKYIIISALWSLSLMALVILQPDFGGAIILFIIWLSLLLLAGIKKSHFVIILLVLFLVASCSWFFLQDYQKDRIATFINPSLDPYGRGYNLKQSIIAIGAGQIVGRGVASGSQSQLKFLPESQNDFIFAVLAEELGLVGVTLLLFVFFVIFYRLQKIAKKARDDYGAFLVLGIFVLILSQFFINIGMNLGILPVIGLSLPLVSYGGSGLFAVMVLLGLAESVQLRGVSTK